MEEQFTNNARSVRGSIGWPHESMPAVIYHEKEIVWDGKAV